MPDIDLAGLLDDPRIAIGELPLGDPPAGADLRGEPAFDLLEAEFRKMETAGPTAVDWKLLNDRTLDILKHRSKDVTLACRMVYGLYREEAYVGMAVGISVLHGMVSAHWDGMYPGTGRERARAGSFDWFAERLAQAVEAEPPSGDRAMTLALVAHDRLAELDVLLSDRMRKYPAALGPLLRALRPHARAARAKIEAEAQAATVAIEVEPPAELPAAVAAIPAPGPVALPVAAVPAAGAAAGPVLQPAAAAVVAMPAISELPLAEGADKALQSLFNSAMRVATAVRQEGPSDPRVYLCSRFAMWGGLAGPPPDKAGRSMLPPPPKARLAEVKALLSAGNQTGLLAAAESLFVSSPFLLDAQRLVAGAMQALGPHYSAAQLAVTGQTAAFLKRMPGLAQLSFSDGTPFADADTRAWIGTDVDVSGGETVGGGSALERVKADAHTLGQQGQPLAGLKLLDAHVAGTHGGRALFLGRLETGEYCLRFDLLTPLFALIDLLEAVAAQQSLRSWDPELLVALASLAWRACEHKNASRLMDERENHQRKAKIIGVLSELDIVTAVRLTSPSVN